MELLSRQKDPDVQGELKKVDLKTGESKKSRRPSEDRRSKREATRHGHEQERPILSENGGRGLESGPMPRNEGIGQDRHKPDYSEDRKTDRTGCPQGGGNRAEETVQNLKGVGTGYR